MAALAERTESDAGAAPAPLARALDRLAAEAGQYFRDAPAPPRLGEVTVTERPLSQMARVQIRLGAEHRRVYVKLHRKAGASPTGVRNRAHTEFETLRALDRGFREIPRCFVPRPLAYFPEEVAVVTEEAEGVNLHALLRRELPVWRRGRGLPALIEHCRQAGTWLRHFQALTRQPDPAPLPAAALLARLRADLDACITLGWSAGPAQRLFDAYARRLRALSERTFPVVGVHPDFQPDNILVSARGVTVIDFASFHHGPPFGDVARFLVSVDFFARTPAYPAGRLSPLMAAFLEGYGQIEPESRPALALAVIRFVTRVAASARAWSIPQPLRWLAHGRVVAYVAGWERRLATVAPHLNLPLGL